MSAVLRASGTDFDVDRFCSESRLTPCAVYRRGEPVLPASQPHGRRHEQSGVHVDVSEAEFDEFPRQVQDAVAFLTDNRDLIRHLCKYPGVEGVTLDFAIARRDVVVQCDHLPPELVRVAGELGLGIELSQYPV